MGCGDRCNKGGRADLCPTPGPSPEGEGRRAPRWVIPFIRSLERTGQVRAAAADAGIDHTTAYQRRRAHGDFAAAWERALEAHAAAVRAERAGDFEGVSDGPLSPLSSAESPSPLKGRGEHLVGAG
jgi:hypothetical protein